ncbi:MAG: GtrA family protein, partial [Lachnospiraceae bacterium]|nr:GtrA family protein [Lachnospiraceae bacterium]
IELFYNIFHWNYWVSSITSYVIGSIYSFFANKKLTFKVEGQMRSTAIRFAVNVAVCYGIAYGIAKPLVKVVLSGMSMKVVENVALLVGMGLYIILNFFGQKFFVFREKTEEETVL